MIRLGLTSAEKAAEVRDYCERHGVTKVFVLDAAKMRSAYDVGRHVEHVEWDDIVQYRFFYRLLQEIDKSTLVVVDELLRTQDRNCLTYNCVRHFLQQTGHQIVFQYLPIIDTFDDFMVLFDFDTRSRWKRDKWRPDLCGEVDLRARRVEVAIRAVPVATDERTRAAYTREKRRLIDGIGLRDPHTIPRTLHLMSGRAKLAHVDPAKSYVGRNMRFGLANVATYREPRYDAGPYIVFEFCHNFIDFTDFLALSRQTEIDALASDLSVDAWYVDRYQQWTRRLSDAYSEIQQ